MAPIKKNAEQLEQEAPAPGGAPAVGDPTPPDDGTTPGGGAVSGAELPPPPDAPDTGKEPTPEAPPPPNPPAVGQDRPDQTAEEIAAEAQLPPPPAKADRKRDFDDRVLDTNMGAQADRGRSSPDAPLKSSAANALKRELVEKYVDGTITDEELAVLAALRGPSAVRQAMPTTDLPPAPAKHADGSVDALPGQTEGATSGQTEARVFFRSEGADSLRQVLPNGEYAKFEGSVFSTTDPDVIGALRARMDAGDAHFYEEDPAVAYSCPFCRFSSPQKATVNSHIRTRHPAEAHVQL